MSHQHIFSRITIDNLDITNTFFQFKLKTEWLKEKLMQHEQLQEIQEAIAGFLWEQVINPSAKRRVPL